MLSDELWPSVGWMRWQGGLGRRPRGLAAARLCRIASLFGRAPRAWLAWRRAVAAADRSTSQRLSRMSVRRRVTLGAEILLAYRRARRRMARENDARTLVALTRRGTPAMGEIGSAAIDIAQARRLGGAVRRALWMLPAHRGCLARSLVLVDLLQRRGVAATLVIGARADPTFRAHAWVEVAGEPLLSPGDYRGGRLAEL
jgi:predicted aconitase with swiveling domain